MSTNTKAKGKKKYNWAPYLLILPSLIYLAVFFAWPMVRGLTLAVWTDEALLTLQEEATQDSDEAGTLPQGTAVTILDHQGNLVPADELDEGNLQTEIWYQVQAVGVNGQTFTGWVCPKAASECAKRPQMARQPAVQCAQKSAATLIR